MAMPSSRRFLTISRQLGGVVAPAQPKQKYKVAIVGGGSAGVSVGAQLLRKLPESERGQIAIIEPRDVHLYQPYWTMVGGLGLDVKNSARPMNNIMPPGVEWIKEHCLSFEPEKNKITVTGGIELEYDVLVVAAGMQQNFGLIPGLKETMGKNRVASIYSYEYSPKVWENILATVQGTAIFTNPATAVNCGGAPQKIAYLADSAWRSRGVRSAIDMEFCTASPGIFACPIYRVALEEVMRQKGIKPHVKTNLIEVDGDARIATFEKEDGSVVTKCFDFLHVTPPMSAPEFVKNSPLANSAGYVDVDKETCQHVKYSNVFSLGDCSSLPTSKTYSAISSEAPVVVHNVVEMLKGNPQGANAAYDGYTACPVLLGDGKLMLAEFNGYTMEAMPTFFPLDQRKPSTLFYLMKRFVFEQAYWHFVPIGRWYGKRTIFEPPIKLKVARATDAKVGSVPTSGSAVPPSEHAALKADVAVAIETSNAQESIQREEVSLLKPSMFGVSTPDLPGDVSIAGDMPVDVVTQLASRHKGWLYLNTAGNPNFHLKEIEAAGCQVKIAEVPPAKSGALPGTEHANAVLDAMEQLPRPLIIQCTSGKRAGAALLLWLAKKFGHNQVSATVLAKDMDLEFFTRCSECGPVRDWVLAQLPAGSGPSTAEVGESMTGAKYVIQQLFDSQGSCTFTYLVGCTSSHEAILIDPVLGMQDRDLAVADELGFNVKYLVNTHVHADHITSGTAIKQIRPEVKTVISEASGAEADVKLLDGDCVTFGEFAIEAAATPGHTAGCMTFVLRGPGNPEAAFTGDALLIRGCGRTDFQQGDADALYESVHQRIFTLPGTTKLYPGHDYTGRNLTTVDEEQRFNPRLTKGKQEFVQIMKDLKLPNPKMIDVAVPANMVCGDQARVK